MGKRVDLSIDTLARCSKIAVRRGARRLADGIAGANLRVLVLVAVVGAANISAKGSAAADSFVCGSVVTSNATLTGDLQACPADGLIVAGDGITVDLAGYTITGTGQGVGIRVLGSAVLVKDGSVESFGTGIQTNDFPTRSAGTTILHLKVSRNTGPGIAFHGFDETLGQSIVTFNGSDGVLLAGSDLTTIIGNKVFRNSFNGIDGQPHADGAVYTDNDVSENGENGIATSESTARVITYNTVNRNGGDGIEIRDVPGFAPFYLVAANLADDNAGHGINACILNFRSGNFCEGGFVDGGGNAAKHNATEPQCVNISCSYNRGQARITSVPAGEHPN
jgi:Right handed beta helix region